MAGTKSRFDEYVREELNRYRGIGYPVKSNLLRRIKTWKIPTRKIHPNPEDEFCFQDIGPNYKIISDYEQQILQARKNGTRIFSEPLTVQKMHPDGYMLLNGHHRWAAAVRLGEEKVPVRIVNLTTLNEVQKMIRDAKNNKRVTFDLDEVIFPPDNSSLMEPPLHFPLNRIYPERMRLGVPALFNFLQRRGYDIWVFSARYYSTDYLKRYFRRYHIKLDGIVTGLVQNRPGVNEIREELSTLTRSKYPRTIHIDGKSVLCIDREKRHFSDYDLSGSPETWSREIMDYVSAYEKQHQKD